MAAPRLAVLFFRCQRHTGNADNPGRKMQVQSVLDVLQVPPRDVANTTKPIAQSASVDTERLGCSIVIPAAIQIMGERCDQIGVLLAVVAQQRTQPFRDEVVNLRPIASAIKDAVQAEILETSAAVRRHRFHLDLQRPLCLSE